MASKRSAGELGRDILVFIEGDEPVRLAELFATDGVWELAYAVGDVDGDRLQVRGPERIARFHARIRANQDAVRFTDIEVHEVGPDLAFIEFRSEVVTKKGVPYSNRYVGKATAADGRLVRWLEFFDPRPADMIARDYAESAGRNHGSG